MAALALLGWLAFSVLLDAQGPYRPWVLAAGSLVLGFAVALFAWMLSLRLTVSSEGLSYRSLLGSRELRWADVEKIRLYDRGWVTVHGIPIAPPDLHVEIFTRDASRLRLGDSFAGARQITTSVMELTRAHLRRHMLAELDRGGVVELDAVRLSRIGGVELRGLLGTKWLAFDEIERYGADDDGNFRIWRRGGGSDAVPSHRVANLGALMDVMATVTGPPTPAA
jgi:hypothetical protein